MTTYVLLSELQPGSFADPKEFKALAADVSKHIREQCPGVHWKQSFATMGGRCDVVDIIETDDPKQAEKAAMLIRSHGHMSTEMMVATNWDEFVGSL
jgi:uncharacterized protein with GYD domain